IVISYEGGKELELPEYIINEERAFRVFDRYRKSTLSSEDEDPATIFYTCLRRISPGTFGGLTRRSLIV
ncbi:hypothetical protein J7K92_00745, partial [bacterium]|nr:hypothetical protein [bacterium]